ncbi:hypothetical protein [Pelagicoccus sp. SDUM812003]|uniref:hypothetical protein n=1 Tax=Pelagicoccus sp. SDUM812003 TaxID=3041267 RepID=UPI00280D4D1E|nr:hypothetical protein [Pelagicoccus sp. SDUM812003]MDQ8202072.1 hypothetical protein [Pelagicoccus sp. SDUM812003]
MDCPYNPFNPRSPKAFDAIVSRGLTGAARWLEKTVGQGEWARRFDAMDRRFLPERDLPLISYETQWSLLDRALGGEAYPAVQSALEKPEGSGLRNEIRILLQKLSRSRAMLVEVIEANQTLPYYRVWNAFDPQEEFLYVDFGDQEPLEKGALMFGRFLSHENCLYVIPGVFVGSPDIKGQIMEELVDFLGVQESEVTDAMQDSLPEVWNICAGIQDERDGVGEFGDEASADAPLADELYRVTLTPLVSKSELVLTLRHHPFFEEVGASEYGVDPFGETAFDITVSPPLPGDQSSFLDEEENPDYAVEDEPIRVGTLRAGPDWITISALNPVELELIRALVVQLVACEEA